METALIVKILDTLMFAVSRMPAVKMRVQAIQEEMQQMVAEGRDPTQEQATALGESIDRRLAALKAKTSSLG